MWINIEMIKDFYDTEEGKNLSNHIQEIINKFDINQNKILSIGYNQINNIPTIIPARQGLANKTILADENMLPVADSSVDIILVIHTLEYTLDLKVFLNEVYRVLKSYGTAIFVFPNLYANIALCNEIFKYSKSELYFKYILKRHSLVINNITHLSILKQFFSSQANKFISVISAQKHTNDIIKNASNITIPAKT